MSAAAEHPSPQVETLFERWLEHGDRAARERIIEEYMPLARSLAKRYRRSSEPLEDLVQVAALALVKAVDRFDPAQGRSFGAYAVPTILGELRRYFRDSGWALHVPRSEKELAQAVAEAGRQIMSATGRAPTAQRLAEFMELDVERVLIGLSAARAYATRPLDVPDRDDEHDLPFAATHGSPDVGYEQVERRMALAEALSALTDSQVELLQMRFGEELTQAAISRRIGVSQMHVSRLLRRCFEHMHDAIEAPVEGTPLPGER